MRVFERRTDKGVRRIGNRWPLLGILMAAWGMRLHELVRQDIWWDEARNIDVALRPILQVATAPELDIHPPIYFWLLHGWGRLAGVSMALEPMQIAFLMRFVSVLAGIVGVALLYALALRIGAERSALLAAAIAAFSPFWLAESQESRMYTVGFALLTAAAIAFVGSLDAVPARHPVQHLSKRRLVRLIAFSALSALALTTHYNAVFVVAAWYLWWGVYVVLGPSGTRLREVVVVFITGLVTVLLASPVTPIALRQIPGYENPNLTVPSVPDYLWQNWQAYIGGYAYSAQGLGELGTWWLVAILVAYVIGLALHLFSSGRDIVVGARSRFSFVFFWLAGGLALYYVAVLDRGAFNVRYSSFVTPALYLSLAIGVIGWRYVHVYLPALGAALVLAGFAFGVQADWYDERNAREDISGVVRWLHENAERNDVVFVDQKYPFGFYYDRYAIDPDQDPVGAEKAAARYLFVDINDIVSRLNEWAADAEHVYWVQWFESDTDPRRAVSFLLDQEGERQGEESFRGYSIDWWRLDPPNQFALASSMERSQFQFDQALQAVEVSMPQEPVTAGGRAPIVIRWERVPGGSVDRPLKARVALYGDDDARLAQTDPRILNDRHVLPAEWSSEDRPLNVYSLELPADLAPGSYPVRLLVYDAETLEALALIDEAGNPSGVEAELGEVQIVSEE